jgi:DNA-binding transcriptional ArsR family regulator
MSPTTHEVSRDTDARRAGLRSRDSSNDRPVVTRVSEEAPPHLELLNDEYAQSILTALVGEPKRGRELIEGCGGSRSTVYRRLDQLIESGLVTATTRLDPNGHHCKQFRLVRDTVSVTVDADGITVTARQR